MIEDITTAVGTCAICKVVKAGPKPHYYTGPLAKDAPHPFHTLNLDILGPLPKTSNGKEYIVSFICTLTRYAVLFATKDHTAATVGTCLLRLITTHGVPRAIISDRGTEFGAKLFAAILENLGITLKRHEPYAHYRSGTVERFHGTLQDILSCYSSRFPKSWDEQLHLALFAYHTSHNRTLGMSPFKALFGREPCTIAQMLLDLPDSNIPEIRPIVSHLHHARQVAQAIVDPKSINVENDIIIGDLVYKAVATKRSKLAPRYVGQERPFEVVDRKGSEITYLDHQGRRAIGHVSAFRLTTLNRNTVQRLDMAKGNTPYNVKPQGQQGVEILTSRYIRTRMQQTTSDYPNTHVTGSTCMNVCRKRKSETSTVVTSTLQNHSGTHVTGSTCMNVCHKSNFETPFVAKPTLQMPASGVITLTVQIPEQLQLTRKHSERTLEVPYSLNSERNATSSFLQERGSCLPDDDTY